MRAPLCIVAYAPPPQSRVVPWTRDCDCGGHAVTFADVTWVRHALALPAGASAGLPGVLRPPADRRWRRVGAAAAYARERAVGIEAVVRASRVCQQVFRALVTGETLTKKDKSPVTGTARHQAHTHTHTHT
jgi:hypothetical protein